MIGPFQLGEQLGVGGMGIVYHATYVKTGQFAAVKVLTPAMSSNGQLVARFEREMEILKRLQHPHIVRYFGGGKAGNQHFYAMELMDGGSVEGMLKKKGKLTWEQTIEVGLQVCKALEHAHRHGIIHRDLKPANLFVGKSGKIKLGDFGIARDTEATALTAAGKTVGTYAYMAPEQISGKPPVSGKTDLYALGCVLFELLTGRVPFTAETPAEMLFQHLQDEPPRVTQFAMDCPIQLEQVVTRLLSKQPEDRYYDALAAQVALDEVGAKVAEQESVAKQTVAGNPSATSTQTAADQGALASILGKKKKKKKKQQPFYERASFLSACLVAVIGVVTWLMWPLNEEQLFVRGEALMKTDDPIQWTSARDRYLQPLIDKYPEGRHATQARDYLDFIAAEAEGRRVENTRNKEPRTEAERLYREAREFENFGDRITALEKYRSMVELLKGRDEDRPFVTLAKRQMTAIEAAGGNALDRLKIVNGSLRDADTLLGRGNKLDAQKKWNSVITLYAANKEFEPQVKYARARLAGEEPEPLNLSPESDETEGTKNKEIKPASATSPQGNESGGTP